MMQPEIHNLMLVLAQDSDDGCDPESAVVQRAVGLAEASGARLHLLQVLQDTPLTTGPLVSKAFAAQTQTEQLERATAGLEELTQAIETRSRVSVAAKVVWTSRRPDAILEQAQQLKADLIMKRSRDESYILGLFSNTDWELLRHANVPVWLTHGSRDPASGVLAAIECQLENDDDEVSLRLDGHVFEFAKYVCDLYDAPFHLVHAFQVAATEAHRAYLPIYPDGMPTPGTIGRLSAEAVEERDTVARRHGLAIQTFVEGFGIPLDDLKIEQGATPEVIKHQAEAHEAGLIVMGAARDKGRWDRVLGRVSAEPSLDNAPCDIVFVH